ncbi:alanine--tRNA ligase [bacterium]|nr:alanine--tRNA ligase [candidate division CSSED10-310 bacterium]
MKTSAMIRKEFIDFFLKHDHTVVRGTPLYIPDDPTLLFTNAGMNQFKPIFLGKIKPVDRRAVNSQRCMRVSGKHNDLEEVGFSPHHHTLFEMLGNWSFGDYYKKEAITWAWDLLTNVWGLPKDKLWVTVFRDDQDVIPEDSEAADYWNNLTGIDPDKICFFGRKDNFWEMGESGPCGPCTEIHIDRGPSFCGKSHVAGHTCTVNGDCRRIVELWNLVFIQYNRIDVNTLVNLPSCHVDTGMGLERVTSVMQNAPSNYDTDLFKPIIDTVQSMAGQSDEERRSNIVSYRVIADHIRASSFLLTDGILPSNEWRGYVLRRIIRRAVRFGTKIGFSSPFLFKAADTFIDIMAPVYPELREATTHIKGMLKSEEDRFFKTLEQGLPMVMQLIKTAQQTGEVILPGADLFKLYDTFGFPLDITREIAVEAGLDLDEEGFQNEMQMQKTRARSAWKQDAAETDNSLATSLSQELTSLEFTGYDSLQEQSRVLAMISQDVRVQTASANSDNETYFIISPSPFYAESGGQVGDTGLLETPTARVRVSDTLYFSKKLPILVGHVTEGSINVGDSVVASVERDRRRAIARNHTATHLLHSALRQVIGDHVKQAGSLVQPDRLRFDFTHFSGISIDDLEAIERFVNDAILSNLRVTTETMALDEAIDSGVTALFGERYDNLVRVLRVNDLSAELCGGTHVLNTGEIGVFKILSEYGVSAGVRRIEAITGFEAWRKFRQLFSLIHNIADSLKSPVDSIGDRIERMQHRIRDLSKENMEIHSKLGRREIDGKLENPLVIEGIKVIIHDIPGMQSAQLRDLADQIKQRLVSGITILASVLENKVILIAAVTSDLTNRIHAGKLVGRVAEIVGGGGGGRPDMAQAGGSQPQKLNEALSQTPEIIASLLSKGGV